MTWNNDMRAAPMDGRPLELYRPPPEFGEHQQRVVARWDDGASAWAWPDRINCDGWWDDDAFAELEKNGDLYKATDFTHWKPLTPAPT